MRKRLWKIVGLVVLVIVVASIYFGNQFFKKNVGNNPQSAINNGQTIPEQEAGVQFFEPGVTGRLMVMDLGSTGCVPCQMMTPILEELTKEYQGRVDVQFIDVYDRQDIAAKYGIRVIPTQIFFSKNGQEVYRHEGFFPKEEIIKQLKTMGSK